MDNHRIAKNHWRRGITPRRHPPVEVRHEIRRPAYRPGLEVQAIQLAYGSHRVNQAIEHSGGSPRTIPVIELAIMHWVGVRPTHVARLSVVTNEAFSLGGSSLPIGKQDVIAGDNHPRIAA